LRKRLAGDIGAIAGVVLAGAAASNINLVDRGAILPESTFHRALRGTFNVCRRVTVAKTRILSARPL